jgi:TolB-like protein/Tfp pilus assembly protein PilF
MSDTSPAVFLSYASEDAAQAEQLCASLRAAGIEVWFDQSELRGGDAWDAAIRKRIKACALFIPLISANSHARAEGYFRLEWKLAVDRSHLMARDKPFLLPVIIDNTSDSDDRVPDKFREVQWTRLRGGEVPAAFIERVRRLLATSATAASPPEPPSPSSSGVAVSHVSAAGNGAPARTNSRQSKAIVLAMAALVAVSLAYFLASRPWTSRPTLPAPAAPAAPAVGLEQPATVAPATPAISDRSIAVLPFIDLSERKDQEYFSDGLSEELIGLLSKVPDLRVPARTSSFFFKGKSVPIAEIAATLRVAHVLEGSVRRSGKIVRVSAQLTRVDTGYQVWSDTYDRPLTDVFGMQRDIAESVVKALQVKLPSGALTGAPVARDSNAYNLYLQGQYFSRRASVVDTDKAIGFLRQSIAIDPSYAPAHVALGHAYLFQAAWGAGPEFMAKVRTESDVALKLDPNLLSAMLLRGNLATVDFDPPAATRQIERAFALAPRDGEVLHLKASIERTYGRLDSSLDFYRRAIDLDPMMVITQVQFALALQAAGRIDEARAVANTALSISPTAVKMHLLLALLDLAEGHRDAARTEIEQEPAEWYRLQGQAILADAEGRTADADAALKLLIERHPGDAAVQIAQAYALRNDRDRAFHWLDLAYKQLDAGLVFFQTDPLLKNLRSDPRFAAMKRRLKL